MRRTLTRRLVRFFAGESGPTAVEYAVMLALIVLVCVVAIGTVGSNTNSNFSNPHLKTALTPAAAS